MKTPVRLSKILARTSNHPIPPAPNLLTPKPTNRIQKTGGKMDNDNDSMDDSKSASDFPQGMHVMTTRASARLLEKLQKLKEMPTTTEGTPMEYETDDIKK